MLGIGSRIVGCAAFWVAVVQGHTLDQVAVTGKTQIVLNNHSRKTITACAWAVPGDGPNRSHGAVDWIADLLRNGEPLVPGTQRVMADLLPDGGSAAVTMTAAELGQIARFRIQQAESAARDLREALKGLTGRSPMRDLKAAITARAARGDSVISIPVQVLGTFEKSPESVPQVLQAFRSYQRLRASNSHIVPLQ